MEGLMGPLCEQRDIDGIHVACRRGFCYEWAVAELNIGFWDSHSLRFNIMIPLCWKHGVEEMADRQSYKLQPR